MTHSAPPISALKNMVNNLYLRVDSNLRIADCNQHFIKYLKISHAESVLNRSATDFFSAQTILTLKQLIKNAGQQDPMEKSLCLGGEVVNFYLSGCRNEDGNLQIILLSTQCIETLEKLRMANQTHLAIVRNLRHDWITPLADIYSINKILAAEETDPKKKEWLEAAANSSEELMKHVKSILHMIEAADSDLPIDEILMNPWKIVRGVYNMYKPEAIRKKIDFNIDLRNSPIDVSSDPVRLERILMGLISNAMKFSNDNAKVSLSLQAEPVGDNHAQLNFFIKDSGVGMTTAQKNNMYDELYCAHPAYEKTYKGAGAGLAMVKRYISDLNGEIACESVPNSGTTFMVTIPCKRSFVLTR